MKKIILSIKPNHVENIIKGLKKYEYRKKLPREKVKKIIIYSTSPIKKVVAEVEILNVLSFKPEVLWEKTKNFSGIDKSFFDLYFKNRDIAFAFKIGKVKIFQKQKAISDFGLKTAPQSFCYV